MSVAADTPKILFEGSTGCLAYRLPNTMYHSTASAS
jgi:hypothetical protein